MIQHSLERFSTRFQITMIMDMEYDEPKKCPPSVLLAELFSHLALEKVIFQPVLA